MDQATSFLDAATAALTDEGWSFSREEQSKCARDAFSLDTLTDEWVMLFKEKLAAKIDIAAVETREVPSLPPYEGVLA